MLLAVFGASGCAASDPGGEFDQGTQGSANGGAGGASSGAGGQSAAGRVGAAGSVVNGGSQGLGGGAAGVAGTAGGRSGGGAEPEEGAGTPSLGGQGEPPPPYGGRKFVGNISTRDYGLEDFATYWDQITPENESKWDSVEGTRDQMNWGPVDAIYNYAEANGLLFKLHTFVWGKQQPGWVSQGGDVRGQVEEWMAQSCQRYPNVSMIDVVNEPPPHTTPTELMNALGGAGESGYDWIVESFRLARRHCPNAILILNDFNNIEYDNADNQQNFIKIAKAVKEAGAPVDAVGAQAHDAFKKTADELRQLIDKLASVGLPIYITEYDIDVADDAEQKRIMEEQFQIFWNDDRIKGITLWGYVYGRTWKPDTGLIRNGQPRPAMTWLTGFLAAERGR